STLQRLVRSHEPGETITVDVMRYGERQQLREKLDEAPAPRAVAAAPQRPEAGPAGTSAGKLGIVVQPLTAEVARARGIPASIGEGLVVTEVAPDGRALDRLASGWVITDILHPAQRRPVRTQADLQQALSGL